MCGRGLATDGGEQMSKRYDNICPNCGGDMHEYFMGDDKTRYRCMACETKVEVGR